MVPCILASSVLLPSSQEFGVPGWSDKFGKQGGYYSTWIQSEPYEGYAHQYSPLVDYFENNTMWSFMFE
eukprot:12521154-Prorocentrum_lima.AAC.1